MITYILLHNVGICLFSKDPGKTEGKLSKFYNQGDENDMENITKAIKKYERKQKT